MKIIFYDDTACACIIINASTYTYVITLTLHQSIVRSFMSRPLCGIQKGNYLRCNHVRVLNQNTVSSLLHRSCCELAFSFSQDFRPRLQAREGDAFVLLAPNDENRKVGYIGQYLHFIACS